jgi:hypothetical protein
VQTSSQEHSLLEVGSRQCFGDARRGCVVHADVLNAFVVAEEREGS